MNFKKNAITFLIAISSIFACVIIYYLFNLTYLPNWKNEEADAIIDLVKKFDQNFNTEQLDKYIKNKYTISGKAAISSRPNHNFTYSVAIKKFQIKITGLNPSSCASIASILNSDNFKNIHTSMKIGEFNEIFFKKGETIPSEILDQCLTKSDSISLTLIRIH